METQKERMLAGKLYVADDPELHQDMLRAKQLCRELNNSSETETEKRQTIIHDLMGTLGEHGYIEPPFHTDYGIHTKIGKNFYANYDCIFLDIANITIGDNVFLAPRVGLYTAGHPIDAELRREQLEYGYPITIGNDVWIGGNVTVNPGVTIGSNVVIGSGSVVTKDIPDNVVAVGNPCHVLRPITKADHDYWEKQAAEYRQAML